MKYLFFIPFTTNTYRFIGTVTDEEANKFSSTFIDSGKFVIATPKKFYNGSVLNGGLLKTEIGDIITLDKFPEYKIVNI